MYGYTHYNQHDGWHSQHSPFECRVYRKVAVVMIGLFWVVLIVQGSQRQLDPTSFSSPSSEAGSCLVLGSSLLSQSTQAPAPKPISWLSPFAGTLESGPRSPEGKDALTGAVDRSLGNAAAHTAPDLDRLLDAIALVESNNQAAAIGDGGQAVGAYQIRPIFLRDVNRILGCERYKLPDRFDPAKSRQMARVYLGHYGKGKTLIEMARQYNGGPRGHLKKATTGYAAKILAVLN